MDRDLSAFFQSMTLMPRGMDDAMVAFALVESFVKFPYFFTAKPAFAAAFNYAGKRQALDSKRNFSGSAGFELATPAV